MRFFLTIGGCTGFAISLLSSLHAGNGPADALRDAAIGCVAGAALFRAAHWAFLTSIHSHVRERAEAMKQEAAAPNP